MKRYILPYKRSLSLLLAVLLIFGSLPQGAAAQEAAGEPSVSQEETAEATETVELTEAADAPVLQTETGEPVMTEEGDTTNTGICGDSYRDDFTDPRPLNILMIGNSFSWDASDCGYGLTQSQTYSIMKGLVKETYDVHLAVMYRGSSTLAYHATCAKNNSGGYTYAQIGPETGYLWDPPSGGEQPNYILDHLNSRDWDIIVVQAYQHEADGTPPSSTFVGGDAMFEEPAAAAGYLLDYFAEHEPGAKVYYYMPWASVKFYGSEGTREGFLAIAEQTEKNVVTMTGPNSGRGFAGIIPVGTAVENARTTYFHNLRYSTTGSTPPEKEVQLGLLADTQHLSLGIGRYIAGATVARTLIPEEMRREEPELPNIKDSFSLGALPQEYSVIAQLAAEKAVENPYAVTVLSGYEEDLATRLCRAMEAADYSGSGLTDQASVTAHVEAVVKGFLTEVGNAEAEVTVHSFTLEEGKIKDLEATAAVRVGYTKGTAQIQVLEGKSHSFGDWVVISRPAPEALGVNQRFCAVCGFVQTEEVEGSWQKYALAEHLQALPEGFCSGTNLWAKLEPEEVMIDHLGNWVSAGATVYSVTIPVTPGDKIYANSFDVTGTRKGIQVSFLGDYGIVKTTFSSGTYEEFHINGGYLIAPEGAIAVNIPVWNVSDAGNTVHILNYDHVQEVTTVAPTCTEAGYTREDCAYCDQHSIRDVVEPLGHSWADSAASIKECTVCGHVEGGYRLNVESTEVWIDGVKQRVYCNDTGTFVQLEQTDAQIMTVYSYNDAETSEPHAQYPTGMQVWRLEFENGGYVSTYVPEFENLLQYAGASIRVTGVKGIRMITAMDKALRSSLMEGTLGYTLVEYGTCVAWAEDGVPMLGQGSAMHNYAYRRDEADPIFADTGSLVQYTNVLVGFTDDQLGSDLIMRPYMILEDSSGEQITLYGGCVQRSIGCIAKQNQSTFPEGTKADTYIEDIISKVYG